MSVTVSSRTNAPQLVVFAWILVPFPIAVCIAAAIRVSQISNLANELLFLYPTIAFGVFFFLSAVINALVVSVHAKRVASSHRGLRVRRAEVLSTLFASGWLASVLIGEVTEVLAVVFAAGISVVSIRVFAFSLQRTPDPRTPDPLAASPLAADPLAAALLEAAPESARTPVPALSWALTVIPIVGWALSQWRYSQSPGDPGVDLTAHSVTVTFAVILLISAVTNGALVSKRSGKLSRYVARGALRVFQWVTLAFGMLWLVGISVGPITPFLEIAAAFVVATMSIAIFVIAVLPAPPTELAPAAPPSSAAPSTGDLPAATS